MEELDYVRLPWSATIAAQGSATVSPSIIQGAWSAWPSSTSCRLSMSGRRCAPAIPPAHWAYLSELLSEARTGDRARSHPLFLKGSSRNGREAARSEPSTRERRGLSAGRSDRRESTPSARITGRAPRRCRTTRRTSRPGRRRLPGPCGLQRVLSHRRRLADAARRLAANLRAGSNRNEGGVGTFRGGGEPGATLEALRGSYASASMRKVDIGSPRAGRCAVEERASDGSQNWGPLWVRCSHRGKVDGFRAERCAAQREHQMDPKSGVHLSDALAPSRPTAARRKNPSSCTSPSRMPP